MVETVTPLPDRMERIERRIKAGLARIETGDKDWIEGQIEVAVAVADTRLALPRHQQFGDWFDAKFPDINADERAAYAAMGQDPARLREILEKTDRPLIHHIYRNEWFRHVTKPPQAPHRRGKRGESMPVMEEACAVVRPLIDAGARINTRDLQKEHGISHVKFDEAIAVVSAVKKVEGEKVNLKAFIESYLTTPKREKLAKAIKRIEWEHIQKRANEVSVLYEQNIGRMREELNAKLNEAAASRERFEQLINRRKPLFTADQFKMILMVAHPDNSASPDTRAEVFRLLKGKKLQLTGSPV
jgi:hypothetical protein